MLTLLLTLALMIILAAAIVPSITFEIKRDREEEMIHRGVQYSRAIRAYYKKFGRYPAKIEDLENTSQQRFLRKRYKDPITGKDFRLLRFGEAKLSLNGMGGGLIPGANQVGPNGSLVNGAGLQPSLLGGSGGMTGSTASPFGQNSQASQTTSLDATQPDASQTGAGPNQPGSQASAPGGTNSNGLGTSSSSSGDKLSNTTFGGAPIVGVASVSKEATIREYDKKKKYNEWQFVYDPTMDRGQLITTPYQQQLQGFGMQPTNLNGQSGGQNNNGSSFFGNSSATPQNNPNSPPNTNPPADTPVQK